MVDMDTITFRKQLNGLTLQFNRSFYKHYLNHVNVIKNCIKIMHELYFLTEVYRNGSPNYEKDLCTGFQKTIFTSFGVREIL
jgi:uncharacterized Fe-S cluster-containing radical SAM superfamily protein